MMHEYDDHWISRQVKHCLILIILMVTMMSETTVDFFDVLFSGWRRLYWVDLRSRGRLPHQAHLPGKVISLHHRHHHCDCHHHNHHHDYHIIITTTITNGIIMTTSLSTATICNQ